MKRTTPTINELLALECVARHMSVTAAASELCVTPSAISRQVSGIELFFGVALFQRSGRRFVLTQAGRDFLHKVRPALRTLESASLDLFANQEGSGTLNLACVPTFAARWLIPRLATFTAQHPGILLNFRQHLSGNDEFPVSLDAAIRFGSGNWPGVESQYLVGRTFGVVCTPGQLKRHPNLRTVAGLQELSLLQHHAVPTAWAEWSADQGTSALNVHAGPRFEQFAALIRAVVAEMGVGLVPLCLVYDELANGELMLPFASQARLPYGHFLCYQKERLDHSIFQHFRQWLQGCCAEVATREIPSSEDSSMSTTNFKRTERNREQPSANC